MSGRGPVRPSASDWPLVGDLVNCQDRSHMSKSLNIHGNDEHNEKNTESSNIPADYCIASPASGKHMGEYVHRSKPDDIA